MSEYKLSIIIPTFNLENKIDIAFNSIKSQTIDFEEIEVIFVDDNSTDNTYNIIKDYKKNYPNVKVFTTDENSGFAGKPRNIGLEMATADYVMFLDGDDELLVDSCEALFKNITSTESDISIGGQINRYDNGIHEHVPPLNLGRNEIFTNTKDVNLLNITPAISAKLFRREMLEKYSITFVEKIPAQDLVFLIEALIYAKKVSIQNNQYIYYRNIHKKSVSFNITEKYLYGLIRAYSSICTIFEKHIIDANIQEVIFKKHLGFFATQILRAFHSDSFESKKLEEILNSEEFDEFSSRPVFKKSQQYLEFFQYLKEGKYRNAQNLINNLKLNINININYLNLKNENDSLKDENSILKDKNIALTEQRQKQ